MTLSISSLVHPWVSWLKNKLGGCKSNTWSLDVIEWNERSGEKNGCNTSRPSNIRDVVQRNALRCVHNWDACFLDHALLMLYDFLTSKTIKRSIMRLQDPLILRCLLYTLFNPAIQISVTSTDEQLPTLQIRVVFATSSRNPADFSISTVCSLPFQTSHLVQSTEQPFGSRTMAIWSCVAGIFTPVMDWQDGSTGDCDVWRITRIPKSLHHLHWKKLCKNLLPKKK